jgi:hypothetical protein
MIHPAILIACDAASAKLAPEVTLALGRRHPAALPFFGVVPLPADHGGPDAGRLRGAIEAITELNARQLAVLNGFEVEDALHVFVAVALGQREVSFAEVLALVHRTAADFFDQTRLVVHLLLLFPDLAGPADRETRYALAYRQLAEVDALSTPQAALGHRPHSSVDYRWLIDCQTQRGAHAGSQDDVGQAVAQVIAILLEGRGNGRVLATDEAARWLRAIEHERLAAYSAFGTSELVYEPEVVVRYLAAQAALLHLAGYLGDEERASTPPEELESAVAAWACTVEDHRAGAVSPALAGSDPDDSPGQRRIQARHVERERERLEESLSSAVREWLGSGQLPYCQEVLDTLRDREAAYLPGTLAAIRSDFRKYLHEALALDMWHEREIELVSRESAMSDELKDLRSGEASAASSPGEGSAEALGASQIETLESELATVRAELSEVRREIQNREEVLRLEMEPEKLEAALRTLLPPPMPESVSASVADATRREDADGAGAIRADASMPRQRTGWLRRIGYRFGQALGGGRRRAEPTAPHPAAAPIQPVTPTVIEPTRLRHACELAEEWRWVLTYGETLESVKVATIEHDADVRDALEYYGEHVISLRHALTSSTPFRTTVLQPKDLELLSSRYVSAILAVLRERYGIERMARDWTLRPGTIAEHKTRFLERMLGLDEAVQEAGSEATGLLAGESLAVLLGGHGSVVPRHALVDWLRGLLEGGAPLLRPGWKTGAPPVQRWLFATAAAQALIEADPEAAALLDDAGVRMVEAHDERFLTLATALHGFPAYEVRKLLPLRVRVHRDGEALPEHDPLSSASARTGPGSPLSELVMLATALELIEREPDGYAYGELRVRGSLHDLTEVLAFDTVCRPIEHELRAAVERALTADDAADRLRTARDLSGCDTERAVLLEALTEVQAHRRLNWSSLPPSADV